MKQIILVISALALMLTLSPAEMKCEAGKCGTAMKSPKSAEKSPKKMMKMFQSVSKEKMVLLQKGEAKDFCPVCGMTLQMFFKTNHAADVNGEVKQYCSLHCLVEDIENDTMQNYDKLSSIQVVDVKSLKFIDAKKAFYVLGSNVKGTMTSVSKYAFAKKEDAEAFIKEHGGEITDFSTLLKIAKKNLEQERKMIVAKQKMMAQKGEMIYTKQCTPTKETFKSVAEAKAFIEANQLCKGIGQKQLQAVGLYLTHR